MTEKADTTEASIRFDITLDDTNTPESITWQADQAESRSPQTCKAVLMSIWDPSKQNTVKFDLWTKDMTHHEMNALTVQSLLMIAETYGKATGNMPLSAELRQFAEGFGIKTGVLKVVEPEADDTIKPFQLDL